MFNPNPNEQLKERLLSCMRDIYVMEQEFAVTLDNYDEWLKGFKQFPEFRSKVLSFVEQSRRHATHFVERFKFYEVQPPNGKKAISLLCGNFLNVFTNFKPLSFSDYATNLYIFTQFEIAQYRMLTTLALAYGDKEMVRFAEEHLREEFEVQRWLYQYLPEICLYSLEYGGITIPTNIWDSVKQWETVGSVPGPSLTTYPTPTPTRNP